MHTFHMGLQDSFLTELLLTKFTLKRHGVLQLVSVQICLPFVLLATNITGQCSLPVDGELVPHQAGLLPRAVGTLITLELDALVNSISVDA